MLVKADRSARRFFPPGGATPQSVKADGKYAIIQLSYHVKFFTLLCFLFFESNMIEIRVFSLPKNKGHCDKVSRHIPLNH